MRIVFELPDSLTSGEIANFVKHLIEGAARGWVAPFKRAGLPPLYSAGVVFEYEPQHGSGVEDFASPFHTLARQEGDCDDLVIYRLCELYAADWNSRASCRAQWDGNNVHVQVRHGNGKIEDPAVELGAPAP